MQIQVSKKWLSVLLVASLGFNAYLLYWGLNCGVSLTYAHDEISRLGTQLEATLITCNEMLSGKDKEAILQEVENATDIERFEKEGDPRVFVGDLALHFHDNNLVKIEKGSEVLTEGF